VSCHALGSTRKRKRVTTQVVLLLVLSEHIGAAGEKRRIHAEARV
jgi:hypothetical protein